MSEKDINNLKEMLVDFNEYSTDYTKTRCKELEKTVENTLKEIDRLNNIISELEKDINNEMMMTREFDKYNEGYFDATLHYYNKLKELKENNKDV